MLGQESGLMSLEALTINETAAALSPSEGFAQVSLQGLSDIYDALNNLRSLALSSCSNCITDEGRAINDHEGRKLLQRIGESYQFLKKIRCDSGLAESWANGTIHLRTQESAFQAYELIDKATDCVAAKFKAAQAQENSQALIYP